MKLPLSSRSWQCGIRTVLIKAPFTMLRYFTSVTDHPNHREQASTIRWIAGQRATHNQRKR